MRKLKIYIRENTLYHNNLGAGLISAVHSAENTWE